MKLASVPTIKDLTDALSRGEQAIRDAAAIICKMVDADPKCYAKINKATGIHWSVLANLERVGRGAMHYKLLFDSSPASKFLITMPQSQQQDAYDHGVQVVTLHPDGKSVVETKTPQELTPAQARIVFDAKRIRSVDEQIKAAKHPAQPNRLRLQPAKRYEIKDGRLIVLSATVFDAGQLEEILAQLRSNGLRTLNGDISRNQIKRTN
jgi:hypothetical protein